MYPDLYVEIADYLIKAKAYEEAIVVFEALAEEPEVTYPLLCCPFSTLNHSRHTLTSSTSIWAYATMELKIMRVQWPAFTKVNCYICARISNPHTRALVLEEDPENKDAKLGLAEVYENKGDHLKALEYLKQSISLFNQTIRFISYFDFLQRKKLIKSKSLLRAVVLATGSRRTRRKSRHCEWSHGKSPHYLMTKRRIEWDVTGAHRML
jgi:tetratricopeptide (TPR) repeat protein